MNLIIQIFTLFIYLCLIIVIADCLNFVLNFNFNIGNKLIKSSHIERDIIVYDDKIKIIHVRSQDWCIFYTCNVF